MMSSLCAAIKMLLGFGGRWDIKQRPLSPILPSFLSPFIFTHLFFVHSVDAEQLLVIKGTSEPRNHAESEEEERVWRDNPDKDDTSRRELQTKLMSCYVAN